MAKCPGCGETTSIWQRDLSTGLCRKCQKAAAEEERQRREDRFDDEERHQRELEAEARRAERGDPMSPQFLDCPQCGQPSDRIKRCLVLSIWFFLVMATWWERVEAGCPACVRRKLLSSALVNLFTANVAWPILILPMTIVQLIRVSSSGHSREVLYEARARKRMDRLGEEEENDRPRRDRS
jgi:hypothetical protein